MKLLAELIDLQEEKKLGIYSKKRKDQEQIDPKVVKKIQKKAPKTANGKKPLEEAKGHFPAEIAADIQRAVARSQLEWTPEFTKTR